MSETVYESIGDYSSKDCELADHVRLLTLGDYMYLDSMPTWNKVSNERKFYWLERARHIIEKYETLYYGEVE